MSLLFSHRNSWWHLSPATDGISRIRWSNKTSKNQVASGLGFLLVFGFGWQWPSRPKAVIFVSRKWPGLVSVEFSGPSTSGQRNSLPVVISHGVTWKNGPEINGHPKVEWVEPWGWNFYPTRLGIYYKSLTWIAILRFTTFWGDQPAGTGRYTLPRITLDYYCADKEKTNQLIFEAIFRGISSSPRRIWGFPIEGMKNSLNP